MTTACFCCYQVVNLGSIGGATVKECTRRILRHVLTDSCARQMNWKGRGGKVALSDMTMSNIINSKCSLHYLGSPYGIGQTIIFLSSGFFFLLLLLLFFPHLFSAITD